MLHENETGGIAFRFQAQLHDTVHIHSNSSIWHNHMAVPDCVAMPFSLGGNLTYCNPLPSTQVD